MSYCKDCKYFGPLILVQDNEIDDFVHSEHYHECQRIYHDKEDDTGKQYCTTTDKATVVDGEGCFAALRIREDFGCILFVLNDKSLTIKIQ